MIASILAFLIGLGWILLYGVTEHPFPSGWSGLIVSFSGLFYLSCLIVVRTFLQEKRSKAERRFSSILPLIEPASNPLFSLLTLYPIVSLTLGLLFATGFLEQYLYLIPVWIFLTGLALDGLLAWSKREDHRWDLPNITHKLEQEVKASLKHSDTDRFKLAVDGLSEIALRGIRKGGVYQTNQVLDTMGQLLDQRDAIPLEQMEFAVLYLVEQLEMLLEASLYRRLESFAQKILSTEAKLSLYILPQNGSLASYCLKSLGQGTLKAQEMGLDKIADKITCTLPEVARVFANDTVVPPELGSYLACLVQELHTLSKNTFKRDKETPIKQLLLPFAELRALFREEPYVSHPEMPLANTALDQAIETFRNLEVFLHTMPPIEESTETSAAPKTPDEES